MMTTFDIHSISAAETRPLRQQILRPHQNAAELVYPGDEDPHTLHAGAHKNGRLVGIATVTPEPFAAHPDRSGWRLRGMATIPEVRGEGYGAALIDACLAHIRHHGGELIWCNGRTTAVPFYERVGFVKHGPEFEIPGTGPHFVLWRWTETGNGVRRSGK